jgi:hypothetical protein
MKKLEQQPLQTTTEMQEINGKQVPVITHKPVNNGEAANNTELKDMSPTIGESSLSQDEFFRLMRIHNERVSSNTITLSAEISAKEVFEGKPRTDKSGLPALDNEGNQLYYPNRYKVTLTFKGGTLVQSVSEKLFNELELSHTYMFKGHLGFVKDFGQDVLAPIWQSHELVM